MLSLYITVNVKIINLIEPLAFVLFPVILKPNPQKNTIGRFHGVDRIPMTTHPQEKKKKNKTARCYFSFVATAVASRLEMRVGGFNRQSPKLCLVRTSLSYSLVKLKQA